MMRRCVVSVATGDRYRPFLKRLSDEFAKIDPGTEQRFWGVMPEGCPSHQEVPYAFKAFALAQSVIHAELLLWADVAVVPIRSLEPLWEKIERDGAYIPLNGWFNAEWCADSAYADLFPGVPIEEAREMNRIPHAVATTFGINTRSEVGAKLLSEYYRLANTKAFCGPWSNTNRPNNTFKYDPSMMGPCGPPEVYGHRHDQSALSVIAHSLGIKLTPCPWGFSYPPGTEETMLLAVGA